MHRGCSETVANANANSDAPREFAGEFWPRNLNEKVTNLELRRNSLANEIAKISSSLRKFLANGSSRQNSLAIANAMAWCTQFQSLGGHMFSQLVFLFLAFSCACH